MTESQHPHPHPHADRTCVVTGKISYASRTKATRAARAIATRAHHNRQRTFGRSRVLKSTGEVLVRAYETYQCTHCRHWHLGTGVLHRKHPAAKPAKERRRVKPRD